MVFDEFSYDKAHKQTLSLVSRYSHCRHLFLWHYYFHRQNDLLVLSKGLCCPSRVVGVKGRKFHICLICSVGLSIF